MRRVEQINGKTYSASKAFEQTKWVVGSASTSFKFSRVQELGEFARSIQVLSIVGESKEEEMSKTRAANSMTNSWPFAE